MNRSILRSEKGFVLVAAIFACVILLAVGMMVIGLSTGDLRSSVRTVADKKTLAATEAGIHRLMQNFDPDNLAASAVASAQVDPTDATSLYTIAAPARLASPPLYMAGYSIAAGGGWGMLRYAARVTGRNTTYSTALDVDVGVGYGPVPIGTMSQ